MTDLQIFKNEELGEVRGLEINGKPYVVASDVAKVLGYKKPNNAINTHCKYAALKQGIITDRLGRLQDALVIPEGDIYRLIIKSKLPKAQEFEEWVMDEVLPTIRKTGGYIDKNATPKQLKKLKDNIKELEEENARLDYKLATHLISTKQVSLLGSIINYRAGLAGAARADLVKKDMVRELRHKFSISAYGDLQEYQFNDAMNFINHYPVTPDNTKVTRLANFGK